MITSLGEYGDNRLANYLVMCSGCRWFCLFFLPLGIGGRRRSMIVALKLRRSLMTLSLGSSLHSTSVLITNPVESVMILIIHTASGYLADSH